MLKYVLYVLKYVLCPIKNAVMFIQRKENLKHFRGTKKLAFETHTKTRRPFKLTKNVSCSKSNVKVTLPFPEFLS